MLVRVAVSSFDTNEPTPSKCIPCRRNSGPYQRNHSGYRLQNPACPDPRLGLLLRIMVRVDIHEVVVAADIHEAVAHHHRHNRVATEEVVDASAVAVAAVAADWDEEEAPETES
jgi:phosphodiesterase/alkaline phosphatase D-like protein